MKPNDKVILAVLSRLCRLVCVVVCCQMQIVWNVKLFRFALDFVLSMWPKPELYMVWADISPMP